MKSLINATFHDVAARHTIVFDGMSFDIHIYVDENVTRPSIIVSDFRSDILIVPPHMSISMIAEVSHKLMNDVLNRLQVPYEYKNIEGMFTKVFNILTYDTVITKKPNGMSLEHEVLYDPKFPDEIRDIRFSSQTYMQEKKLKEQSDEESEDIIDIPASFYNGLDER